MKLKEPAAELSKHWEVMQDLEDAFGRIASMEFLVEQLHKAVEDDNTTAIIDTTDALTSFLPVYTANWDDKFGKAWKQVVEDDTSACEPLACADHLADD